MIIIVNLLIILNGGIKINPSYPRLLIDQKKIKHNSEKIVKLSKKIDINIFGVTKATCGDTKIAKAMLEGGVIGIADSRIENIKKMKDQGLNTIFMHLRTPMLTEVEDVVKYADISLNTEIKVIEKISKTSIKQNKNHKIILMVEMGDLREGIPMDSINQIIIKIQKLEKIELYGIGMNLACFGGVIPTQEKIEKFCTLIKNLEDKNKIQFKMISGGNSANIKGLLEKSEKTKINNLRVGEGILLGLETLNRTAIPNTHQDAFILETEIIEYKLKKSKPYGKISQNVFGNIPVFKDIGKINRAIIAIGQQDTKIEDLIPIDKNIEILGGSNDHIILHIKNNKYKIGDVVKFYLKYGALSHLFMGKYIKKIYI